MAVEFYIPKMSDHMEEAIFVEWLVADGDAVEKGQPILVIDTDKVVAEVEAPADGILVGIRPGLENGATVAVGVTVAFIVDDIADDVPALEPLDAPAPDSSAAEDAEPSQLATTVDSATAASGSGTAHGGPVRATPAGRKAARELNVNLANVVGSGPRGRISESDVRKHAADVSSAEVGTVPEAQGTVWLELTPVQGVTARRMVESMSEVPQFSLARHLDLTATLAVRERAGGDAGSKPSVTAYLVKAIGLALAEHPRVNGFFRKGRIEINNDINVGVAFGTDVGLFVPVIHRADRLSVSEIADALARLRGLADGQAFTRDDLSGGTFTLSNLGMFGIDEFRALVNQPQAAILATGQVSKALVVDTEGTISIRDRMTATVTADHRSLDGVSVARFLSSVANFLLDPDEHNGMAT